MRVRARGRRPAAEPYLVAPIVDLDGFHVRVDGSHLHKLPDWSHDETWSGDVPAERLDVRARSRS